MDKLRPMTANISKLQKSNFGALSAIGERKSIQKIIKKPLTKPMDRIKICQD